MPRPRRKPPITAPPLANLAVRIPAEVHLKAKLHAVRQHVSLAKLVEQALRDLLRRGKE